jgi:hypothetical protein
MPGSSHAKSRVATGRLILPSPSHENESSDRLDVDRRPPLLLGNAFLVSLGEDGFWSDAVCTNAERTDLSGLVVPAVN